MATTIGSIAEELATEFGEDYSDLDASRQLRAWVIEVSQMVLLADQWPFFSGAFTLNTVNGQRTYPLLDTSGDVRVVRKTATGETLVYKPKALLAQLGYNVDESGEPRAWYYDSTDDDSGVRVLGLYPIPDAAYAYEVGWELAASLADSDATVLPFTSDFLPAIRDGVRRIYREQAGDFQGAAAAATRFVYSLSQLRSRYAIPRAAILRMAATDVPPAAFLDLPRLPRSIG